MRRRSARSGFKALALEKHSTEARVINRAFRVTQRLVRKITNGGTLSRDELRAGELSTQALRSAIADPANAHRVELLVQEAERLSPADFEPRRESRPPARQQQQHRHQGSRPHKAGRKQPAAKPSAAKVVIKKKPKLGNRSS